MCMRHMAHGTCNVPRTTSHSEAHGIRIRASQFHRHALPFPQEAEGSATAIAGEGEAEDPGMAADLDRGDDAGEPRAHRRHKKGRRKKEK